MNVLRVMRDSALLELQQLAVSRFMLFCVLVQPFFIAVTAILVLRHRTDFEPMYVLVGAALSGLWSVVLFDGGWIIGGERRLGTLELLAGSPTPMLIVLSGRLAGTVLFSLLSLVINYVVGGWLFGYSLQIRDPIAFSLAFVLAALSLWSTAVFLSPLGILSRTLQRFLGVLEYPVYTLGGFLFPILLLPVWTQTLSDALPPYWAALALHLTTSPAAVAQSPGLPVVLGVLAVTTPLQLGLAWMLFGLVLRRARSTASLQLS